MRDFLNRCKEKGILISLKDGKNLSYRTTKGAIEKETIRYLREHKSELIDLLRENNESEQIKVKKKEVNIEDQKKNYDVSENKEACMFPLTDIQSAYLSGRSRNYELGGTGCYTYLILKTDKLDASLFEEAWHKVIENHDMLRAVITKEGQQYIKENVELPKLCIYESDTDDIENSETEKEIRRKLETYDFDIESFPMHKIILHQGSKESIVHFCTDMLIADYISINVILDDIFSYYKNQTFIHAGKGVSFRKTVEDKNKKGYREKSEDYWKNKISTHEFRKPQLPVRSVISTDNVKFTRHGYMLGKDDFMSLKNLCKKNNVTVSNTILAVYASVLSKWSENRQFCINVTLMDRGVQELDTVGDYTSVDILAVDTKDKTFSELVHEIGIDILTDMSYMDYTGVDVLRQVRRTSSDNNIFPVVFTSTVGESKEDEKKDYTVIGGISRTPQVWIDCQMISIGNELDIHWDVRDGVFEENVINDIFDAFKNAIRFILSEDNWNSKNIARACKHQLEKRGSYCTQDESLKGHMLYEGFINNVKANPDKRAIIYNDKVYTYGDLALYASSIQKKLKEAGIKEKDTVAIIEERGVLQSASALAVLLLGAIFVPIDINQPFNRQKAIVDQSSASYVLVSDNKADFVDAFGDKLFCVSSITKSNEDELIIADTRPDSTAYIIFTSGTTGVPKGVMISHQSAQNTLLDINKRFGVGENDVFLALTKLSFDLSIYDMFGSMDAGATVVIPKESNAVNPSDWVKLIKKYGVTIWNSVPALLKMLYSEVKLQDKDSIESLKLILLSGDVIDVSLPSKTAEYLSDYKLISLGGATEGSVWSIFYDITGLRDETILPYGIPLSNQKMYVLDDDLSESANMVKGEICIGGYGVAQGYYGDKELTDSKYIVIEDKNDRVFRTGDVGYIRSDGIMMINGRKDNQIKINGNRVETGEIESVIRSTGEVENVVVYYHKTGHSGKLFAFLEPGYEETKDSSLMIKDLEKEGQSELDIIDRDGFTRWRKQSDVAALSDMMALFTDIGIFTEKDKVYSRQQIHDAAKETEEFHSIIDRFLRAMEQAGIIEKVEEGYQVTKKAKPYYDREKNWDEFMRIGDEIDYGHVLMEYQRQSGKHIKEQIRGEIAGISLFFPKGDTTVAEAAYRNNIINLRLNNIVSDIINRLGERNISILEVGAGVGGTTTTVLNRLKNRNIKYCFTDVSQFFINKAKDRYKEYDNMSYMLMDINRDYTKQGFKDKSYDVILCANVLHNSHNIGENLSKLKKLLKDDGYIIIIEATKESYLLTTSLELKGGLDGFTDHRRGGIDVFTSEDKWIELIKEAGYKYYFTLPERSDELAECGQSVFLCGNETKSGKPKVKHKVNVEYIEKTMASKLPKYMIPDQIEILDSIPLSTNGKIDRKELDKICADRLKVSLKINESKKSNLSGLSKSVAGIWEQVLGISGVTSKDNFYYVGGDSLLITQVVSKLRENYKELEKLPWDELMQIVLNNPTVEGMADSIGMYIADDNSQGKIKEKDYEEGNRRQLLDKTSSNKSLDLSDSCVRVYRDNPENRRCVQAYMHAGTGRLVDYDSLIPQILKNTGDDVSVIGFMYGNSNEYLDIPAERLVKERAAKYAEILLGMNAKEYEIIGYCVGGFIAVETARILLEKGKKVHNVYMISSEQATHKISNRLITEMAYGVAVGLDVSLAGYNFDTYEMKAAMSDILKDENRDIRNSELVTLSGRYKSLGRMFLSLIDKEHDERLKDIFEKAGGSKFNGDESTFAMFSVLYRIFEHTFRGMSEYSFNEYYLGNVVYMDAPTDFSFYPVTRKLNKVEDICIGNFEKIRIPGNHATCLDGNNYLIVFDEIKKRSCCF
ncbi:non-ribosomal peptide synthetase [Butyrivibrio sp. NC3005]|uniref:non-ribosomal peptide synthetase n=1 Tax=Butyrivibrio sp. NC3005 TaxID=1280685 RepID=UPI0003F7BADD|nr:non-ribosomal peptide synthetase [Butyrivibrio sp. NC3005]